LMEGECEDVGVTIGTCRKNKPRPGLRFTQH
jgi:hypothetical protein